VDEVVAETGLFDPAELVVWAREASTAPDVLAHLERPVTKLICHHPDRSVDQALLAELAMVCGDRATVTSAGTGWAEIGAPRVTKALALALVCERLGIQAAEVVCVGDSLNDLSMLAWAGLPVAVANARPELLAVARRVVPANDEDGVASLLEELSTAGGGAATPVPASERG
jgi:hydroxymethylpyrimidine pyrophosphatase-like HAD family hydrolase